MNASSSSIPDSIIKLLFDKSQEKRNTGLRELESHMKQTVDKSNHDSIFNYVQQFRLQIFFLNSPYQEIISKGEMSSIFGMLQIIKGFEHNKSETFFLLIQPILAMFKENDPKIICEAVLSMEKLLRTLNKEVVLKIFNDIFEGLLNLQVHPDQEVRSCGKTLDEFLQVTLSSTFGNIPIYSNSIFNIQDLFQKLIEKIRANHPGVKIFIVSWITFIDSIPGLQIMKVLPELLPGLFSMLCDKGQEVHQKALKCLSHFLEEIQKQYEDLYELYPDVMNKMAEITIEQCKNVNEQLKQHAFGWLIMLLNKYHQILSSQSYSDNSKLKFPNAYLKKIHNPLDMKFSIASPILKSNLALQDDYSSKIPAPPEFSFKPGSLTNIKNEIENTSKMVCIRMTSDPLKTDSTNSVQKIPYYLFSKILEVILLNFNFQNEQISSLIRTCNNYLLEIIDYLSQDISILNVKNLETVLKSSLDCKKDSTVEIVLTWIDKLFKKFGDEMFTHVEDFIDKMASILPENNEKIFNTILDILCDLAKSKGEYIEIIVQKLTEKLSMNKAIIKCGFLILRKLTVALPIMTVYSKFADVLKNVKDIEFLSEMINSLNIFLLTEPEAQKLRMILSMHKKENNLEIKIFFEKIFSVWSYNPIATLILCIVSEYFELSYHLILKLSDVKLDQEYYIQLSQLVQLFESSLFNSIRILLLEPFKNIYLVKTLYGILMLLPQGKAYNALAKRVESIEILMQLDQSEPCQINDEKIKLEEVDYFIKIFYHAQMIKKQYTK